VDVALSYDLFRRAEPYATVLPLQEDSIFCHDFTGAGYPAPVLQNN
jgi:hypothetical protein